MKVLIVDDEEHVREGIELSIEWAAYNIQDILMAEDGWEAIELVRREVPELIICDMSMPRMDGPSFLELLRNEGWNSKVIVLSGYQEFRYTRATLLANGVDYLLKPFKIDDLDKAVAKAVDSIKQSQHTQTEELRRNYRLKEAESLINEQKMVAYLQNEPLQQESMAKLFKAIGLSAKPFYAIVFLPSNASLVIENLYLGDESLFIFSVKNVLRDIINHLGPYYCFSYESFLMLFIQTDITIDEMNFYRKKVSDTWEKALHLRTISGLSNQLTTLETLHSSLKEAKAEVLNTNILQASPQQPQQPEEMNSFMENERLLLEAIRNQDKDQIRQIVIRFVTTLRSKPYVPLKELKHYSIEVNLILMRMGQTLPNENPIETIPIWLSDLDEWERTIIHIFHNIIDYTNKDSATIPTISAVKNYIVDHLSEEITLTSLAEKFYFSPQYLSKRFKEIYHTTVMNYLTKLRMENASSLLELSELTIQEIAQSVGYDDENYFGKVFRKYYGTSPTQYRKAHK